MASKDKQKKPNEEKRIDSDSSSDSSDDDNNDEKYNGNEVRFTPDVQCFGEKYLTRYEQSIHFTRLFKWNSKDEIQ